MKTTGLIRNSLRTQIWKEHAAISKPEDTINDGSKPVIVRNICTHLPQY
jgi:hypothetical protein